MSAKTLHVFLAHSARATPNEIAAQIAAIRSSLGETSHFSVTTGRDDFAARARDAGGWAGWACDVVDRIDYETGRPAFDAIVVPTEIVGRATAEIVRRALAVRRPVFLLTAEGSCEVRTVTEIDPKNWKAGWLVEP